MLSQHSDEVIALLYTGTVSRGLHTAHTVSRGAHSRVNAPARSSPALLRRRALRSCVCRKKEFDPGAAPISQRSAATKTAVTSLKTNLRTPLRALKPVRTVTARRGHRLPIGTSVFLAERCPGLWDQNQV